MLTTPLQAGDWPQFRYDAGRTASPYELPAKLQLRWTRALPRPGRRSQEVRLAYDALYEPVVLGHTMFVPSMVSDSVTALDTETGVERWRFFAEGPVRFAPFRGTAKSTSSPTMVTCTASITTVRCMEVPWSARGPAVSQGIGTRAAHLVTACPRRTRVGQRRRLFRRRALAYRGRVHPRAAVRRENPSGRTPVAITSRRATGTTARDRMPA